MRIPRQRILLHLHPGQDVQYRFPSRRPVSYLVDDERLLQDLLHRHARVQGRKRILEHHLHLLAQWNQIGMWHVVQLMPAAAAPETHGPFIGIDRPQDAARQSGLSGTGFAYDAQGLRVIEGKADLVDGHDAVERLAQALDFKQ